MRPSFTSWANLVVPRLMYIAASLSPRPRRIGRRAPTLDFRSAISCPISGGYHSESAAEVSDRERSLRSGVGLLGSRLKA